MARYTSITILFIVGCLLALGSPGGSQVPGGIGPEMHLQDLEDLDALACILSAFLTNGSLPTLIGLEFRLVVETSTKKLYRGRLQIQPGILRSGPGLTNVDLAFLHRVGTPCSTPPDQLFTASTTPSVALAVAFTAQDPLEVEFFSELLDVLVSSAPGSTLSGLATWFDSSSDIALIQASITHSRRNYSCELVFEDSSAATSQIHTFRVEAVRTATGFAQWAVQ